MSVYIQRVSYLTKKFDHDTFFVDLLYVSTQLLWWVVYQLAAGNSPEPRIRYNSLLLTRLRGDTTLIPHHVYYQLAVLGSVSHLLHMTFLTGLCGSRCHP